MNSTIFPWKMLAITASALTVLFVGGFLISGNQPVRSQQPIAKLNRAQITAQPLAYDTSVKENRGTPSDKTTTITVAPKKSKAVQHHKKNVRKAKVAADSVAIGATTEARHDDGPTPLNEMLVMAITSPKKADEGNYNENDAHPKAGWASFEKYLSIEAVAPNGKPGTVKLTFMVSSTGAVSDFKVKTGLSADADKKAIELVKNGPTWAGNTNKQATEVNVSIDFH
ncbi:MAG: energy transducer TonB [Mucilaginibacter sp.]